MFQGREMKKRAQLCYGSCEEQFEVFRQAFLSLFWEGHYWQLLFGNAAAALGPPSLKSFPSNQKIYRQFNLWSS